MKEACYCGRAGEVKDREPVKRGDGEHALRRPDCGHLDALSWLSASARRRILEESALRRLQERRHTAEPTV